MPQDLNLEIDLLKAEREILYTMILELFQQACQINGMYHHEFISIYEETQALLLKRNLIKKEQCVVE